MVSSPVQEFLQATRHRIASFSSARRWPGDHPHRGQAHSGALPCIGHSTVRAQCGLRARRAAKLPAATRCTATVRRPLECVLQLPWWADLERGL